MDVSFKINEICLKQNISGHWWLIFLFSISTFFLLHIFGGIEKTQNVISVFSQKIIVEVVVSNVVSNLGSEKIFGSSKIELLFQLKWPTQDTYMIYHITHLPCFYLLYYRDTVSAVSKFFFQLQLQQSRQRAYLLSA